MVIVAKGRDENGKIYFRYLDPATSVGANEDHRLTIQEDLTITDKCKGYRESDTYYLVELRMDEEIEGWNKPFVDPLIEKLRNTNGDFDEVNQSFGD